jgi:sulfur carrier protein ThiS adenylyltransferase
VDILFNERTMQVENGTTLFSLRASTKPDADIAILNGAIVAEDRPLAEGDAVHFVKRGETPSAEDLESLLVSRHTPGVHAKVKRGTVGIAGLGGLGSTVAVALVRTGVGKLILADFDVVEPSNLNRQQYEISHLGMYKSDALCDVLTRINPYVELEPHRIRLDETNVAGIFGQVDVMVEAFDSTASKSMILRTFPRTCPSIPLVTVSGLAGYGPSNRIRTRKLLRNLYMVGDEETAAKPGMGLMAPRVGIAASHQANAVLRLLLGLDAEED